MNVQPQQTIQMERRTLDERITLIKNNTPVPLEELDMEVVATLLDMHRTSGYDLGFETDSFTIRRLPSDADILAQKKGANHAIVEIFRSNRRLFHDASTGFKDIPFNFEVSKDILSDEKVTPEQANALFIDIASVLRGYYNESKNREWFEQTLSFSKKILEEAQGYQSEVGTEKLSDSLAILQSILDDSNGDTLSAIPSTRDITNKIFKTQLTLDNFGEYAKSFEEMIAQQINSRSPHHFGYTDKEAQHFKPKFPSLQYTRFFYLASAGISRDKVAKVYAEWYPEEKMPNISEEIVDLFSKYEVELNTVKSFCAAADTVASEVVNRLKIASKNKDVDVLKLYEQFDTVDIFSTSFNQKNIRQKKKRDRVFAGKVKKELEDVYDAQVKRGERYVVAQRTRSMDYADLQRKRGSDYLDPRRARSMVNETDDNELFSVKLWGYLNFPKTTRSWEHVIKETLTLKGSYIKYENITGDCTHFLINPHEIVASLSENKKPVGVNKKEYTLFKANITNKFFYLIGKIRHFIHSSDELSSVPDSFSSLLQKRLSTKFVNKSMADAQEILDMNFHSDETYSEEQIHTGVKLVESLLYLSRNENDGSLDNYVYGASASYENTVRTLKELVAVDPAYRKDISNVINQQYSGWAHLGEYSLLSNVYFFDHPYVSNFCSLVQILKNCADSSSPLPSKEEIALVYASSRIRREVLGCVMRTASDAVDAVPIKDAITKQFPDIVESVQQ